METCLQHNRRNLVIKTLKSAVISKIGSLWHTPPSVMNLDEVICLYHVAEEWGVSPSKQIIGLVERVIRENGEGLEYVYATNVYYIDVSKCLPLIQEDSDEISYVQEILVNAISRNEKFWKTSTKYSFYDDYGMALPLVQADDLECIPEYFYAYEVS